MAYSAQKHEVFSQRMTNWMRTLWELKTESERLDAIYVQETGSGTDSAFADTSQATEQEHVDGIVFMRAFQDFIDGSAAVSQTDRTANITPFLVGE